MITGAERAKLADRARAMHDRGRPVPQVAKELVISEYLTQRLIYEAGGDIRGPDAKRPRLNHQGRALAHAETIRSARFPSRYKVQRYLAEHADEVYIASAPQQAIARSCQMSRAAVRNALAWLTAAGIVEKIEAAREPGEWTPDQYRLLGPWAER